MDILAGSLQRGLLIGMVFALVALGLTIIFGVMDIVNFAHGEFLMLGMYTALLTSQTTGLDPLLRLPFAGLVGFGSWACLLPGFREVSASRPDGGAASGDVRADAGAYAIWPCFCLGPRTAPSMQASGRAEFRSGDGRHCSGHQAGRGTSCRSWPLSPFGC